MWCIKCQADVAAEMAPDNRQILCASCGSRIRSVPLLPTEDKTRQARELLKRWSETNWTQAEETPAGSEDDRQEPAAHFPGQAQPSFRLDDGHESAGARRPEPAARVAASPRGPGRRNVQEPRSITQRTHEPHGSAYPPPHFTSEPYPPEEPADANASSSSRLQAFWGQMLAYAGVLVLTIGAAFVLLGYFGGPQWQSYTPTGWLITTTGQMLLFLGVVTLVSGGMEQTAETVARRIDKLGQRIIRIEWASQNHALKGPSLPAEQFAEGGDEQNSEKPAKADSERETAVNSDA